MKFLDFFKKLFSKQEDETEKRRQEIEHSLHAKIKKEKEKYRESTMKKLSIEDIDKEMKKQKKRKCGS